MHTEALDYTRDAIARIGGVMGRSVLEIGSLNINGGARELCAGAGLYWGIDKVGGRGVDEVRDVRDYAPPIRFDLIICNEVLEHAPAPAEILAACARLLNRNGHLILTCASDGRKPHSATGAEHPLPGEYYGNVSPEALRAALGKGWAVVDLDYLYPPGDARLIARWEGRK